MDVQPAPCKPPARAPVELLLQSCKLLLQLHLGLVRLAARLAELLDYLAQVLALLLLQGPISVAAAAVSDAGSAGIVLAGQLHR